LVLACLNLMHVCIGILYEHNRSLNQREESQSSRDDNQRPSKLNKIARLFQKFFGLLSRLCGKLLLCVCKFI